MTEKAAEARRAYKREWAKRNPEKIKEYQSRYWTKKAEAAASDPEGEQQRGGEALDNIGVSAQGSR